MANRIDASKFTARTYRPDAVHAPRSWWAVGSKKNPFRDHRCDSSAEDLIDRLHLEHAQLRLSEEWRDEGR
jgi:hypothetical protein